MRREFRPGFIVINPKYDQGSSGGGTSPDWADTDDEYCDADGWIYVHFEDEDDTFGFNVNFQGEGWYRHKGDRVCDTWHAPSPPSGTPLC